MATLVLSAVGASLGSAVGGSVLGMSSAVIGRAVGATFGRMIDQRVLGQGSDVVPSGQIDRFHLSGASEGEAIARSFGRVRLGAQVIWASRFLESVVTTGGGGKGTGARAARSICLFGELGAGARRRGGDANRSGLGRRDRGGQG